MDLLPQQRRMVDHMLLHPSAAIFADPGLGKTAAVLLAADTLLSLGLIEGVLVIAPLRVSTMTWPNEVRRWFPHLKIADLRTAEGKASWKAGTAHIYTLNYEMIPAFVVANAKRPMPVDMVVFDEIHFAKNPSSKRMKKFLPLRKCFKRFVGLTGTPIANSYMDLFAPIRLLDGGERLGSSFTAFRTRYFTSDYMGWNWTINPGAKDMITGKIADITLTLKATDYLHIPPTTTMDVDVHLSIKSAKEYKELHKNSILKLKEDKEVVGVNAAALIGKLQQFTGGACYDEHKRTLVFHGFKLLALADLIRSIKEPVLVLTMYKHETDRILRMITGAEEFSETSLDRWNKKKIPVLVADPRSIGTGLNLQEGGRHLIWYSLTYSRLLYDQTNARLIRTGQTHETFIHRLMCPNTVDWAVAEALRVKGTEQDGLKTALQSLEYIR